MALTGLFITGTDTGTGKTVIGAALVEKLFRQNIDVQPRKPVESGCVVEGDALLPEDGQAYYQAASESIPLDLITPFRFPAALAPPQAARLVGQSIKVDQLEDAVYKGLNANSYCVVEGAGGFYSPIAEATLNADLANKLNLPVLLVASDKLGCINHVLLTLEAIANRDLECLAVVLNRVEPTNHHPDMNNAAALEEAVSLPIIEIGHCDAMPVNIDALYDLLSLPE